MSPDLTALVALAVFNVSWVNHSTKACVKDVAKIFLKRETVIFIGDEPITWDKPMYITTGKLPPVNADMILLLQHLSDWKTTELRGNTLIITETLDILAPVWPKYRLIPVVLILQSVFGCSVYNWTPLTFPMCNNPPELKFLGSCKDITLINKKISQENNIAGCNLTASLIPCPIFVNFTSTNKPVGAEVEILYDLTKHTGIKLSIYRPFMYFLWYYTKFLPNGSYSGVWSLLDERTVDLGGSCNSIGLDKWPFEMLPSHIKDDACWHLPGPQPMPHVYGFANVLPRNIRNAVGVILLAIFLFSLATSRASLGTVLLWTITRILTMSSPPLIETSIFRMFSVLVEFCALVIITIYRSRVLFNLFITPMLIFKTGEEGAHYGLKAFMRIREAELLKYYHNHLKRHLMEPGRLIVNQSFNFDLLVKDKTAMIMARTILDQAQIRIKYPNIAYASAVSVDKTPFATNNVAFLMSPHHPLLRKLTLKMLDIIQAGLPDLYLRRELAKLPGKGTFERDIEREPLRWANLASVFYLWLILSCLCLVVFIAEWIIFHTCKNAFQNAKNKIVSKYFAGKPKRGIRPRMNNLLRQMRNQQ